MTAKLITPTILLFILGTSFGCTSKPPEDLTKPFQGTWQFGIPKDKMVKEVTFNNDICKIVEKKDTTGTEVRSELEKIDQSTFQVDNSKSPAEIDFVYIEGENQGKTRPGIFVFEGEKLTINVADFDAPRPTQFAAAEKTTLMILERKK
jgi:uncharacterized protein (TIGR03067 family)